MKTRTLVTILALSALPGLLAAQGAPPNPEIRSIVVRGEGEVQAAPDIARLSIEVASRGEEADDVSRETTEKTARVLQEIRKKMVLQKDIRTLSIRVQPRYRWHEGRNFLEGYTALQRISVTVRELSKSGAILAAVVSAGATSVQGPFFEFSDPKTLERKALQAALTDAKEKAKLLAAGSGLQLGRPLHIVENPDHPEGLPRPHTARGAMAATAAVESHPPQVLAGEETVRASVRVEYALKD